MSNVFNRGLTIRDRRALKLSGLERHRIHQQHYRSLYMIEDAVLIAHVTTIAYCQDFY